MLLPLKANWLLSVMVRFVVCDESTVITTGDQLLPAPALAAAQVTPALRLPLQEYPHIGTTVPSGNVVVLPDAIRLAVPADAGAERAVKPPRSSREAPKLEVSRAAFFRIVSI